jgi:uncharacterized protein YdeI (YjbR/CyaY-like superfamily)
MKITFFKSPAEWRRWLERNHDTSRELWVGYYKKGSGKPSITWPESVDEALSFGWIDGIRKSVDDESYTIRFTPRRPRSIWSEVNVKRARELIEMGRMHPAGLKVFEERVQERSGIYAYENQRRELADSYLGTLKANKKAWEFFRAQPPGYQRTVGHWVMSAKKEETRAKRLATLIDDSANGRRIAPLRRAGGSK